MHVEHAVVVAVNSFPAAQVVHVTEGWLLCSWKWPARQSAQGVDFVENAVPEEQNLQTTEGAEFSSWYFPVSQPTHAYLLL